MDKEEIISRLKKIGNHAIHVRCESPFVMSLDDGIAVNEAIDLLKEQEPRVMTLDEAAAAHEVWAEVWLSVPKKYVIVVTVLYLTDDCKNFELELLGTNKKAFMLTEAYGHTWRCWTARPTEDQRLAVKWDD